MIKCLPKDVQEKLRSGVAIFSLQQCVEELVLNSIDAGATCIAVRMDVEACKVQVVDNGSGMSVDDVERVGNRYFTSKCSSLQNLENLSFYGFRGEAISSIVSLSTLVEISSRSKASAKTFTKVFKEGKGLDVFETTRPSPGTTVTVCNFFHGMPVRRKRMDSVLECERVRQRVEAISLMHPSISFSLKNDSTGAMVVQLPKAQGTYCRFAQIHGQARARRLREVSLSRGHFEISGFIGREGHYNSSLQFLYVNRRLLLKTRIHKLLSLLLRKVSGQGGDSNLPRSLGSPKQRGGAELHGMYLLNVQCQYSEYDVCLEPAKTLVEFKDWDGVLRCVEEGVRQFLSRENLTTHLSPEEVQDYVRENTSGHERMASEGLPEDRVATCALGSLLGITRECQGMAITRECYEGKTLASKPVYRRLAESLSSLNPVGQADDVVVGDGKEQSDLKQDGEPVSLSVPLVPIPAESITCTNQCDPFTHAATLQPVPSNDVTGCTENNHSIGLEERRSLSGGDSLADIITTEGVTECERQRLVLENIKEIDSVCSDKRDGKPEEGCRGRRLNNHWERGLEPARGGDPGWTKLQLGSVGFIKHVLPQPLSPEGPERRVSYAPKRFRPPGPSTVQDLFPRPAGYEALRVSSQERGVSRHSRGPASEAEVGISWAPKRKLSLLGASCFSDTRAGSPVATAHKIAKVAPRPKLALSVDTGSLDRFRRLYCKKGAQQRPAVDTNHNENDLHVGTLNVSWEIGNVADSPEKPWIHPDEVTVFPPEPKCAPVPLSEFTALTLPSAQPGSGRASLAARLSRLKHGSTEDQSEHLERHCPSRDSPMLHDGKEVRATDTPRPPSNAFTPDNNANPPPGMEKHPHGTLACPEPAAIRLNPFCKLALTSDPKGLSVGGTFNDPERDLLPGEATDGVRTAACLHPGAAEGGGEAPVEPGDWLEHFDDSVGKLAYINRVTGLSKYETPPTNQARVPCTTDVTTMAVSVVTRNGCEYRCYPFQTEIVLPFLPRYGVDRVLSSGPNCTGGIKNDNSLSSLFSEWTNPVFIKPAEVAVDVTSGQAEGLAVKIHNILYPYRFTKAMMQSMKVVHQVDNKFLACLINTRDQEEKQCGSTEGNLLVLVDQHAAHERVRLEKLVADSYEEDPDGRGQKQLRCSSVTPPLEIDLTEEELRLLRSFQPFLRGLGLEVRFVETGESRVLVGKVPVCFVEREANELRRGRQTVTKALVEEYIREQVELLCSAGRVRGTLPLTVQKLLASQACHGAIKFNTSLSKEECCSLVDALSACQLPFQCAHGRPSMVPLADLLHLDSAQRDPPKPNLKKLRQMYRAWELYGTK